MSQSDYIAHKKNAQILKRQSDLEGVLNSQDFTQYKQFAFHNTITNTNTTYNQLREPNKQRVYKMELPVSQCPQFLTCTQTQSRPNRVITMSDPMGKRGFKRRNGYNEYFVHQKANNLIMPCKMFRECNEYFYLRENPYIDDEDETTFIIA